MLDLLSLGVKLRGINTPEILPHSVPRELNPPAIALISIPCGLSAFTCCHLYMLTILLPSTSLPINVEEIVTKSQGGQFYLTKGGQMCFTI